MTSTRTLALALLATCAGPAMAQDMIDCDTLPNVVYLQVGDTQEPLMKALGRALRDSAARPISIVYNTSGSCTNIEAIYTGGLLTTNPKYIPSSAEDPAWTPAMAAPVCRVRAGGVPLDVANSALFVSACNDNPAPAGIGSFSGPVQPYVFVVPSASSQTAITAEEAYFVFGFGAAGQVEPWTDEAFYFIRTTTKSTLLALAANIRVQGAKWKGNKLDKSSEVVSGVNMSTSPEKTIGILGAEIYDKNRATMKALAFRTFGQKYAYYPDSSPTLHDKRPTREGQYMPWSPTVYLTKTQNGVAESSNAGYVIDLITSRTTTTTPDFDVLKVIAEQGLVPSCAMKVQRDREGGNLSLYSPEAPCHCKYESVVDPQAASACTTCTDDGACGGGKCRHGFCEAR